MPAAKNDRFKRALGIATLVGSALFYAPSGLAQQAPQVDPRVQQRAYNFGFPPDPSAGSHPGRIATVNLPYAVFVSSKVTKARKSPLIVVLHGLGGNPNSLMQGDLLDLAEAGGYIVVAPAGYNPRGWYGIPSDAPARPREPAAINDPPNLTQLSEKDVRDVLAIAWKEFNVDEHRIYLMGHSMGGAGTLYLGSKYASTWAAVAAIAPAAQRMEKDMEPTLTKLTMPVLVVQGDADKAVPVDDTRKWVAAMKDRSLDYKYDEIPGGDHSSVIATSMPDIFAFFNAHSK
jgi:dienelactone hydrolase